VVAPSDMEQGQCYSRPTSSCHSVFWSPLRPPLRSSMGKTSSFPVISLLYSGSLSTSYVSKLIYILLLVILPSANGSFVPSLFNFYRNFNFCSELRVLQLKHACISSKSSPSRTFRGNSQTMHSIGTRIESRLVYETA